MKKILVGLVMLAIAACGPSAPQLNTPYNDASTQFIVIDIEGKEGMKEMTSYCVEVVDANDLVSSGTGSGNLKFWFCDTLGKYKLGQPIHFDKNR